MEEKLDLVSNLPCEILRHILSFLPLKEAVRSSSLSTEWRQVLAPFHVKLRRAAANKDVEQVLGGLLSSYSCPQRLKLSLSLSRKREDEDEDADAGLLVLATKGVEKELHLDFFYNSQKGTNINNFHLKLKPLTQSDSFSSLRALHLRSVNSQQAISLVSDIFAACHLLQSLKLEKCLGLQEIHVEMGNSECLRSLTILDCPEILSLTVSAPNLKSFWYRGVLPQILQMKSAFHLVEATLDFRLPFGHAHHEFDCEQLLCYLASIKQVQSLTISAWLLQWMCEAGVIFGQLDFQFNRLKELYWVSSCLDRSKRDSLACFFNICPLLEKLFVQINDSLSSIPCPFFHQHWHEPHLWMDYEMVNSNTSQLKHLKMFKLAGFSGGEDELLLIELLLNRAVVLESMEVT